MAGRSRTVRAVADGLRLVPAVAASRSLAHGRIGLQAGYPAQTVVGPALDPTGSRRTRRTAARPTGTTYDVAASGQPSRSRTTRSPTDVRRAPPVGDHPLSIRRSISSSCGVRHQPTQTQPGHSHPLRQARCALRGNRSGRRNQRVATPLTSETRARPAANQPLGTTRTQPRA